MFRHTLTGWQVQALSDVPEAAKGIFPATVPGCVHTDLLAVGVIEDPYWGENEPKTAWIGRTDWRYSCTFRVSAEMLAAEHLTLVCDGLDTVAEIRVNGELVAQTESMHVGYRFELTPVVSEGENTLEILFRSPVTYAEGHRDRLGNRPNAYPDPLNFIRKMACNFGWDWGPTLVTAGVWRDCYLESWSGVRLAKVRPLVLEATEHNARLEVVARLEGDAIGLPLQASLTDPQGIVVAQAEVEASGSEARLTLTVNAPQRWWPRGYGEQPLYTLVLSVGESLWQGRVGLRAVELDTTPDEIGAAFTLKVNGKPVFCKGANWIPDDCFPTRVTRERYLERITQAVDANMNMLRVWGGGIYEAEAFYDLCDELGVMVWQDFLFACAGYPEEAPFTELVEAEARYNVTRLSRHSSLVLWNGNNENLWGFEDWGWKRELEGRSWGKGFYLELLPKIVAELDPSRPYWPGSPWSGDETLPPNLDTHGPMHIWDVWNQIDYTHYRDYQPRFAAEFGFQAPPTFATLRDSLPAPDFYATSPAMLHHQKALGGNDKLMKGLTNHFGTDVQGTVDDFSNWLYLTQLNQARALTLGVEWFRSLAPRCMGALYWQLNDCWPVTSWAAVDGYGRKKPLWYASRHFFADQRMTFGPGDAGLRLSVLNDTDTVWTGEVSVRRMSFSGDEAHAETLPFYVEPRSVRQLELPDTLVRSQRPETEFLVAQTGTEKATWFFAPDKDLEYPKAELEGRREGDALVLTAGSLVRDLTLFVDRLNPAATISDNLLTLLPGESVTLMLGGLEGVSVETLLEPPVMNCANRFGRQR